MRTRSARTEAGQATVESALTIPMMTFALLGILQLTLAYHARILSEYAVFKAARAGSVYRAECKRMKHAALVALAPSFSLNMAGGSGADGPAENPNLNMMFGQSVGRALLNTSLRGTPIVWVDFNLENTGRDFDLQLGPGSTQVMRLRVKMAYFFRYRVPFANWIMVRFWLASQRGMLWSQMDPTSPTKRANQVMPNLTVDGELVNRSYIAAMAGEYVSPIVATWSMRMMSDPLPNLPTSGNWKCK